MICTTENSKLFLQGVRRSRTDGITDEKKASGTISFVPESSNLQRGPKICQAITGWKKWNETEMEDTKVSLSIFFND